MYWPTPRLATATLLVLGLLLGPARVFAEPLGDDPPKSPGTEETAKDRTQEAKRDESTASPTPAQPKANGAEKPGDETGSRSPAKSQSQLAALIFQGELRAFGKDDPTGAKLNSLIRWSKAILDDPSRTTAQRVEALAEHLDRTRALRELVIRLDPSPASHGLLLQVEYFHQEAKAMLAQAKAGAETPPPSTPSGPQQHSDIDPRSAALHKRLDEPIDMAFRNETPLEDVLKYIRSATADATGKGLPIYVDPIGLQEAERTMTSPVSLELQGVPLRTTLTLLLRQVGMAYEVKDGVVIISNISSSKNILTELRARAERGELSSHEATQLVEMLKTVVEVKRLDAEGRRLDLDLTNPKAAHPGGGFQ